jgi:lipopolysaccharide/colanic/teichoic acid biosynthesis glycosyltransferase
MSSMSQIGRAAPGPIAVKCPLWKRAFDSVLGFILLVLTSAVIGYAMALVRLTSRGPAIYTQVRQGPNGRRFTIYKIRTMYHDSERLTGPQWSKPGDPRVTWLGRILRATHIDELPQLWNVLRGEMSLVGPRPERPEIIANIERTLPAYHERLRVRPGLTGLAQILLPPDVDMESVRRKLDCDLYYIEHVGPWLDLRILIGTALKVLGISRRLRRRLLGLPDLEAPQPASHLRCSEGTFSPEQRDLRCGETNPLARATLG